MTNFLNPDHFKTEFDTPQKAQEQYAYGLRVGTKATTIFINHNQIWSAHGIIEDSFPRCQTAIFSSERIGIHANTADLLRGFLHSNASIIVEERGEYKIIKQCQNPGVSIPDLLTYDQDVLRPVWREIKRTQFHAWRKSGVLIAVPRAFLIRCPFSDLPVACKEEGEHYFARLMTGAEFQKALCD